MDRHLILSPKLPYNLRTGFPIHVVSRDPFTMLIDCMGPPRHLRWLVSSGSGESAMLE
jgi:hypothetical protein